MKVILLQDIKSLGRVGDVKNVANGYARNFLLPKNLVKPGSPAAIQELEAQKAKFEKQLQELRAEVLNIESATAAEPLTFRVRVGKKGEVFSSVGAEEIKEKLIEKFPKLQPVNLEIKVDHIREIGRKEIEIKLKGTPKSGFATSGQLEGTLTIEVIPQQP